jgi:hypothetical protein
MPEICRFYGIIIRMYFDDHAPPHFHASYGNYQAVFGIENLGVLGGTFPPRAHGLVVEWATQHQDELRMAWDRAQRMESPGKITPLD